MEKYCVRQGFYSKYLKRFLDFSISLVVFLLISPFFLLLCILVRIKLGGPIFFKQKRCGKDEKPFEILKFRTMTNKKDEFGNLLPDVQRFTRFGTFLRNTSLDELPELLNVLKGDMSLIGPRPLYLCYVPYYNEEESLRHSVRGGITGLAQINGRALCKWDERFKYDVNYVKNITFINDLKILFLTIRKVFRKEGVGTPSINDEVVLNKCRAVQRPNRLFGYYLFDKKVKVSRAKEIGSDFDLSPASITLSQKKEFLPFGKAFYLSTCRSAIKLLLENYSGQKVVLMPAFTCHSVVEPFINQGFRIIPYSVDNRFRVNIRQILSLVRKFQPGIFFFHDYFGFSTNDAMRKKRLTEKLQKKGIVVINDQTQSMFSSYAPINSDYYIGSIRKWASIPDGAYLKGLVPTKRLECDIELEKAKIFAMEYKHLYLYKNKGTKTVLLNNFRVAEEILDSRDDCYKMSGVSKSLLTEENIELLKSRRFVNASILLDNLKNNKNVKCPFKRVSFGEVPFFVPVFIKKKRKEFQQYLAHNNVFATVIWACPDEYRSLVDKNSQDIYDRILCIPCDQRYSEEDMQYVCNLINNYEWRG